MEWFDNNQSKAFTIGRRLAVLTAAHWRALDSKVPAPLIIPTTALTPEDAKAQAVATLTAQGHCWRTFRMGFRCLTCLELSSDPFTGPAFPCRGAMAAEESQAMVGGSPQVTSAPQSAASRMEALRLRVRSRAQSDSAQRAPEAGHPLQHAAAAADQSPTAWVDIDAAIDQEAAWACEEGPHVLHDLPPPQDPPAYAAPPDPPQ